MLAVWLTHVDVARPHRTYSLCLYWTWAVYVACSQIDGFRFDIMGHLLLRTLNTMRDRLDKLTPEKDGVDGK